MAEGMLSLSWNNHSATFCNTLSALKEKEKYADATITCEGKFYPVHKLVLSTCSEYFEKIFDHTSCKHPVIVLNIQSVDLEAILSYMYDGAVNVDQTNLPQLLKVADLLQIKGLAVPDELPSRNCDSPKLEKSSSDKRYSQWSSNARDSSSPRRRGSHGFESKNSPLSKRMRIDSQTDTFDECGMAAVPASPQEQMESSRNVSEGQTDFVCDKKGKGTTEPVASVQASECELEIKEETMEMNKLSEGEGEENYEPGVSEATASEGPTEDPEDSENLMLIRLDQANNTTTDQSPDFLPHPAQDAYPHDLATTLPGPSDMQQWFGGDHITGLPLTKGGFNTKTAIFPPNFSQKQMEEQEVEPKPEGREGTPRIHPCPYCKYSTWKKVNLTKHLRIHTGERPYPCPYCQAKFSRKQCLTRHIRTHTGEKPYGCSQCPYRAIRKQSLVAHISTHHKHNK